jgi:hypothetical protein
MNDPDSVPAELQQSDLHMIGNYAISMRFSDGHHTGIYTFKYLRDHAPEKPSRAAPDPAPHGRSPRGESPDTESRATDRERPAG